MKSKIIAIVVLVVVVLAITFTLKSNKQEIDKQNTPIDRSHIPIAVSVFEVAELPSSNEISLPALLQANETATISVASMGKIISLDIELGSKVSKGQVIGRVDTRAMQKQEAQLELTVAKLKADYERNLALKEGNAISAVNLSDSKYNYESNKFALEQLQQQISDANIVSPLNGIITDKKVIAGEFVGAGTPIATVVDVNRLKTMIYVSENDVYYLKLNQDVTVNSRLFPDKNLSGKITYISPNADNNHRYKVEVTITDKENIFKAGTYVNVQLQLGISAEVLQVSKSALVNGTLDPYVFVTDGKNAHKRKIVLGREIGDNYEVIDGLTAGERVVTAGKISVTDGCIVKVEK